MGFRVYVHMAFSSVSFGVSALGVEFSALGPKTSREEDSDDCFDHGLRLLVHRFD